MKLIPHINMTYRTRKRLKTAGLVFGTLAVVGGLLWLCWVIWLGRFVVYSRDAAKLDFDWQTPGEFVVAEAPTDPPVKILFDDGSEVVVEKNPDLQKLSGVYVTADMLVEDLEEVDRLIRQQEKGTAVMLELKGGNGNFYYNTAIPGGKVSSKVDADGVDDLIKYLRKADYYTIALVPAFRDRNYGLENTAYGIHHSSGRYLWAGEDKCYWLDPAKNGTRNYLISIASELRDLGFDEVVFTDFRFPPTTDILYEGDQTTVLNETAEHLVYNLATDFFGVSFLCNETGFVLPEGRTRLYRSGVDASMAQNVASTLTVPSKEINLVYLTEAMDTRFDAFSVLRPLATAMTELPTVTTPTETTAPTTPQTPVENPPAEEPQEPEGGEA